MSKNKSVCINEYVVEENKIKKICLFINIFPDLENKLNSFKFFSFSQVKCKKYFPHKTIILYVIVIADIPYL